MNAWRKWKMPSVILIFLLGGWGAWFLFRVPEPSYRGKPLGRLIETAKTFADHQQTQKAVKDLGEEAFTYLLYVLENEPTILQKTYAKQYPRIPPGIRKALSSPPDYDQKRARAVGLLSYTGRDLTEALPLLARIGEEDQFFGTRLNCTHLLAKWGPGSLYAEPALKALTITTLDSNEDTRAKSHSAITRFSLETREAVAERFLNEGNQKTISRERAIRGLSLLAPNTAHEEKAIEFLLNATSSESLDERRQAYVGLGTFTNQFNRILPALLAGLKEPRVALQSIEALVNLGERAIPSLNELAQRETGHIRPAKQALEKIEQRENMVKENVGLGPNILPK